MGVFAYLTKTEEGYIPNNGVKKSSGLLDVHVYRCLSREEGVKTASPPQLSSVNSRLELRGPCQSSESAVERQVLPRL